jgi:peptidyl-prolyl cis-trans isomerase C
VTCSKNCSRHLGWIALTTLVLAACESSDETDPVVARVDDAKLTVAVLTDQIPGTDVTSEERRLYVDKWLQQELLYQEALEQDFASKARVQRLIDQATRDLIVAAYIDETFEDTQIEITDEDVEQRYHLHSERYLRHDAEIHAQHILVGSRRDASSLRQALLRGESFEDKARDLSLDLETHTEGGDLGFFAASEYPELWEACANLTKGQISQPVSSERGYHIVRLLERKEPGTVQELADVEQRVRIELIRERHVQRLDDLITRLKDDHSWHIDETLFE